MKKTILLLIIALICSLSTFSATRYLVDFGSGNTWTDPTASGGTRVNLATVGTGSTSKTFQQWFTDKSLATPTFAGATFVTGDEVWMAAGTYTVGAVTTLKDGVNIYGSFFGNETVTTGRDKNSTLAWDFKYQTILDGGQTTDFTGTTNQGFGGLTAPATFTTLTIIDGLKVTRFYKAAATNGCAVTLNTNSTMQNCIVSNNKIFSTTAGTSGAGVFLNTTGAKLLNSYIYSNTSVKNSTFAANGAGALGMGDITVKGCTFESNASASAAGGLFISYSGTYLTTSLNKVGGGTIEDCIFKTNTSTVAGGGLGMNVIPTNPLVTTVKNCQFIENTSSSTGAGASLLSQDGTLTLEGCQFVGNASTVTGNGGLYIASAWATVNPIKNCIFRNNKNKASGTDEGSAFSINKVATIQNCVIANNTSVATYSAGYMSAAGSKVYNCTFANNSAVALKFAAVGTCEAKNNIFWNNTENTISGGTTPTLDYNAYSGATGADAGTHSITTLTVSPNNTFTTISSFQGAPTGTGQTLIDNKANSAAADWSLMSGCFAINAGVDLSASPNLITNDILGNARPFSSTAYDMGAYEYGYTAQTITFSALTAKTYGDSDFSPATASSGLTVTYTSSNTGVASVSGSTITIVGKGSTNITASQAGNSTYSPATSVTQQLVVNAKAITITANSTNKTYNTTQSSPVTGSSAYTITSGSLKSGETIGSVTLTYGAGAIAATDAVGSTSTITPSAATGGTFNAGNYAITYVTGTLTVTAASQTITLASTGSKIYGDADYSPATASSGLTVSYGSSNTAVATIVSGQIHIVGVGQTTITASQAGNSNYNAATNATQTLTVGAATLTLSSAAANNKVYDNTNAAVVSGTLSGILNSDDVTCTTGTFASANVGNGIAVTCVLGGTKAGNYTLTQPGVTANITAIAIPISVSGSIGTSSLLPGSDISVDPGIELTVDNDGGTTVHSITVSPGGKLTLASGKSLNVLGALTLQSNAFNGTATFIDNGGTLNATTTNVQQYLTTGRNWYISSPVSGAYSSVFNAVADANINKLYSYDETQGSSATLNWPQVKDNSTSLAVTKGYVANVDASLLAATNGVTFSGGSLNTGDITTGVNGVPALSYTANQAYAGYNLVGNPYPSYLNWNGVTKTNLATQTMWYRTNVGGNYYFYTYNSVDGAAGIGISVPAGDDVSNFIPPMQAFWVKAASGSSLTFHNTDRGHKDLTNNKFRAKSGKNSTLQLARLQVSNGLNSDETVLYGYPNATNQLDSYDSPKMSNGSASIPEIYTLAGGEKLVINGMNNIPFDTEIPLGFTTGQAGTNFSIKASQVSNFDAGTRVILKDYQDSNNPLITDLSDGISYVFSSGITTNNSSRFALIFKAPSIATGMNPNAVNDLWISTNASGQIIINGNINTGTIVEVYNAVGQKISSKTLKSTISVLDNTLCSGVYMLTVTSAGNILSKKVIVK